MEESDIIIIGAGPAGLTAGIYTGREGLKSIIIEKKLRGGNANMAPVILNYPGYKSIPGMELLKKIAEQAEKYTEIRENEEIKKIERLNGKFRVESSINEYLTKSIIFCSGTTYRKIGVEGEEEYVGRGISYCSICDGMLFKGRNVIVVGGGNSAAEHALHLNDIGVNVKLIHRRDELRAQKYLQDKLKEEEIPILWNTVLKEIKGKMFVEGVVLYNNKTQQEQEMDINGIFIAVGEVPNRQIAKDIGAEIDEMNYIIVDKDQQTNIPGIYAAGDITGGVNQLVVACGEGAVAAVNAYTHIKKEE